MRFITISFITNVYYNKFYNNKLLYLRFLTKVYNNKFYNNKVYN